MIVYSHHTVTPTPHYFPIPNSILIYYYRNCSYMYTHASLQSIYSKFKGRLATHFRSNSFATYDPIDVIVTSTNGLKFRILFSRRCNPAQYWSQTRLPRRIIGDRPLHTHIAYNRALFFRHPVTKRSTVNGCWQRFYLRNHAPLVIAVLYTYGCLNTMRSSL